VRWEKRGLVFRPSGDAWWARSHAYLPTADVRGDIIRVYFSGLDAERFGRIGFVDLDAEDPTHVLRTSREPVLDLGVAGAFDDSGVNPSCVLDDGDTKRMYYVGWQRSVRVPYLIFAGLATSMDGGATFERHSDVPVLERTPSERFIRSATTIVRDDRGYQMWYVSANEWIEIEGRQVPRYVVRRADSTDGLTWQAARRVAIDYEDPDEYGFGRPWVVRHGGGYRMWYSIRSRARPYCIGYAHSVDGIEWTRDDANAGITASEDGWDSEMICFPCVVSAAGRTLMFYNGNGHGATGFGYAELVAD
jgi:hypothetical protein